MLPMGKYFFFEIKFVAYLIFVENAEVKANKTSNQIKNRFRIIIYTHGLNPTIRFSVIISYDSYIFRRNIYLNETCMMLMYNLYTKQSNGNWDLSMSLINKGSRNEM